MLIPSHRHTPADLALWAEYEDADLLHAPSIGRKVERSLEAIREFVAAGPCYCSVSWGKDSVVVAHLVGRVARGIPLAWVRVRGWSNPDCESVMAAFGGECDVLDVDVGHDRDGGTLETGFRRLTQKYGQRRIVGVRADESGIRRMSLRRLGLSTGLSCRPLGWWTVDDVFAYLASHRLPVHPAYAMLGGGRWAREHLRVASLGGVRGTQFGRAEWEREYYGDDLARLGSLT